MEQERPSTQTARPKFQQFDLVWGKIMGWPWWPGMVVALPSPENAKYTVEFIQDPTHAFLLEEKLLPYAQGRDRHSTPKLHHKNFSKALAQAERLAGFAPCRAEGATDDYSHRSTLLHQQIQIINQESQAKCDSAVSSSSKKNTFLRGASGQKKIRPAPAEGSIWKIRKTRKPIQKRQKIEQRKVFVEELLKKYQLLEIPRVQKSSEAQKESKASEQHMEEQCIRKYLSRAVEKALRSKVTEKDKRFEIASWLAESVLKNKKKGTKGAHRAVFQWINSSEGSTIQIGYTAWPVEEKHDHLTLTESY